MPTLHGVNGSPFVRKVRVALAEKGIAYRLEPVIPLARPPGFEQKSPLGKIPVWEEEGGYTLPDSSCILAYLERLHPTPALYPADARELGRALFYEEYADTRLAEGILAVFFERFVKQRLLKQASDEERVRRMLTEFLPPVFTWLDAEIGGRPWLVGGRFGVADLSVGSFFVNLRAAGEALDAARWPNLTAFVERVHARPSFAALIEEERAGLPS